MIRTCRGYHATTDKHGDSLPHQFPHVLLYWIWPSFQQNHISVEKKHGQRCFTENSTNLLMSPWIANTYRSSSNFSPIKASLSYVKEGCLHTLCQVQLKICISVQSKAFSEIKAEYAPTSSVTRFDLFEDQLMGVSNTITILHAKLLSNQTMPLLANSSRILGHSSLPLRAHFRSGHIGSKRHSLPVWITGLQRTNDSKVQHQKPDRAAQILLTHESYLIVQRWSVLPVSSIDLRTEYFSQKVERISIKVITSSAQILKPVEQFSRLTTQDERQPGIITPAYVNAMLTNARISLTSPASDWMI